MKFSGYISIIVLLVVFTLRVAESKTENRKIQEYMIQIKEEWVDTVILQSPRFGLKQKRKLVSNIYLFEEDTTSADYTVYHVRTDIKAFKDFFADKILHVKKREKALVKYYPSRNGSFSEPKTTFGRWILQPRKSAHSKKCWPYYDMGVEDAWSLGYTGLGVHVAVVDIGIEMEHPDLIQNFDKNLSYSFVDKNHGDVNPKRFPNYWETEEITSHGTMAAGLISGQFGNDVCSSGIAFNSKIAALKVFNLEGGPQRWAVEGFAFSVDHIPTALAYKRNDIDIYSCSFNLHNKFKSASLDMKTAVKEGAEKGRKGKGSIYVFSAGNNKGPVYDCNMEALANSIYTITISSVGVNGSKPSYAIPCASALASTYGEFSTHVGSKKLETTTHDGKCDTFKGTSASAALASGIFALILQANPYLTWRDLQYITILSSSFQSLKNTGRRKTNAAGLQYDPFFGFGLINVTAMVDMAQSWKSVPPQKQLAVHETESKMRFLSENTFALTLHLDGCKEEYSCIRFLEHVQLRLRYKTNRERLMDIILCSPSKTYSYILNKKPVIRNGRHQHLSQTRHVKRNWNFTTVHFWGENPTGPWLLLFRESATGGNWTKTGQHLEVLSAVLILFGASTDPLLKQSAYNGTFKTVQNNSELQNLNLTEWFKTVQNIVNDVPEKSVDEVIHYVEETTKISPNYWVGVFVFLVCTALILTALLPCLKRKFCSSSKTELENIPER